MVILAADLVVFLVVFAPNELGGDGLDLDLALENHEYGEETACEIAGGHEVREEVDLRLVRVSVGGHGGNVYFWWKSLNCEEFPGSRVARD